MTSEAAAISTRARRRGEDLRDRFHSPSVGKVQVKQDAAGDAAASKQLFRLGQRAHPG
jgi:hypothetical protein